MRRLIPIITAGLALLSCAEAPLGPSMPMDVHRARAEALAREILITDGHIDLPNRLMRRPADVSARTPGGEFDYPRAVAGGLDAPFMSIYVPAARQIDGTAKAYADTLINLVRGLVEAHPDKFALAGSPDDVEANFERGLISLPMGMENGAPLEDDLANVRYFYDRGIRYITLTHSRDNQISDSSYDTSPDTHNGLSEFGRAVVREMNRVGIMVDVSHITDSAFADVMAISEAPVIASHSSARRFTPGFERNMSDTMIRRLAENGGVIQINFGSSFLDGEIRAAREAVGDSAEARVRALGLALDTPAADSVEEAYYREHPRPFADITTVADHIDHVVSLVGVDHVAFGSDFDGVGDSLPTGLKDVSMFPNLIAHLLARGYSEDDIRKMAWTNVRRVWREVEATAQRLQGAG